MTRIAVFPGSFDPFTLGHADLVARGLELFDKVVIAVGVNAGKTARFSLAERLEQIQACYPGQPKVEVLPCEGLTVDFAHRIGAGFILRGVRSTLDFEYERQMAEVNRRLSADSPMETILLPARPELEAVQSSVVRELLSYGHDVSQFVPQAVLERIRPKA